LSEGQVLPRGRHRDRARGDGPRAQMQAPAKKYPGRSSRKKDRASAKNKPGNKPGKGKSKQGKSGNSESGNNKPGKAKSGKGKSGKGKSWTP
jgi:hypothetical protein